MAKAWPKLPCLLLAYPEILTLTQPTAPINLINLTNEGNTSQSEAA